MREHRVEDDQQFVHARCQCPLLGLPCLAESLIERPNDRIEPGGHDRAQRQDRARPPQIVRVPRNSQFSRLKGATPTNATICFCVNVPSSGTVASRVV